MLHSATAPESLTDNTRDIYKRRGKFEWAALGPRVQYLQEFFLPLKPAQTSKSETLEACSASWIIIFQARPVQHTQTWAREAKVEASHSSICFLSPVAFQLSAPPPAANPPTNLPTPNTNLQSICHLILAHVLLGFVFVCCQVP